jgi:ABC-type nitrate/sulfonate/bicarbonate transport system ATPase subunit
MEIKNLTKSFDNKQVFDNFNLTIPDGEISFLMGESGCGKTTLMRIIAGLDTDFTGEITKNGNFISYVFQEPRLFPALSVKQNLELVSKGSSLSLEEILDIVELKGEENSYPDSLSGGMKMRLALARAIYHNGDIFLMDEPFSALDIAMKERIMPKIFELLKGKTVLVISHSIEEATAYSKNIIKL